MNQLIYSFTGFDFFDSNLIILKIEMKDIHL